MQSDTQDDREKRMRIKRGKTMARPKGSKNKKTIMNTAVTIQEVGEKIAAIEEEISSLNEKLKERKTWLKNLTKQKAAMEKEAEKRKAEEDKAKLLDAVKKSGKSVEEIIELLK